MKTLRDCVGIELEWRPAPEGHRTFALFAGEDRLATLRRESVFGSLATGEAGDDRWSFKRTGFFRSRVTVRVPGRDDDVAVFHHRWMGSGEVLFPDGRRVIWEQVSFWRQTWAFTDANGQELLRFRSGVMMHSATLSMEYGAHREPTLPLLALLGWYLLLLTADDASGAAAVAATS